MEKAVDSKVKLVLLILPWAFVRLLGRVLRFFLAAVGVLVVLAVVAYVELEEIIEIVDSRYSREIDDYLGIDASTITSARSRLLRPAIGDGERGS